ncbi:MAG: integration host factor [Acidimicrobiia bacterium]|nr:integration host factor [Acidimicrobiia bacterium]
MPTPPKMSDEQRRAALVRASEVRKARAEVKQLLKSGSVSFGELLERAESNGDLGGMKVSAVLAALPGIGKVKAGQIMERLNIAENRRVRGLGDRQRAALTEELS